MTATAESAIPDNPGPINNPDLDRVVMAATLADWSKVAIVMARATDQARAENLPVSGQLLAERIMALVETGSLEARGNIRRWRTGELRLATVSV